MPSGACHVPGTAGTPRTFTEPSVSPGVGTTYTLNEILAKAPMVDDVNGAFASPVLSGWKFWGLRSGSGWGVQTGTLRIYQPGEVLLSDPIIGPLHYVPAGIFTQGTPAGEHCRRVPDENQFIHILTNHLAVMETEVTGQMWAALKAVPGSTLPEDPVIAENCSAYASGGTNAIICITWYEAVLFANLLSAQQGLERVYYNGSRFITAIDANNYREGSVTHPAGGKTPNPWGLRDVHGNAREWCWDWGSEYPYLIAGTARTDYRGSETGLNRVIRGGGHNLKPVEARSGMRDIHSPRYGIVSLGFRLLRSLN